MLIFLVGYAGSGKSSLGRRLARRLGARFVDTDSVVEQRVGASISDIFYYEGEEYFRRAERDVLESLWSDNEDIVVATGGGLPIWSDNMEWMRSAGHTIYLRRDIEQILSRMTAYGREKRPMFRGKSDEELRVFMREQLAEREPYYLLSEIVVECTHHSDESVVEHIAHRLNAEDREAIGNRAIGVYDSGFGGLSVWRELRLRLPNESLIYLGDGKNCPYGGRSREQITAFADEAVERLVSEGVKMVVVGCNTATIAAIDHLRAKYPHLAIVGMEPAVKPACLSTRTRRIAVLATAHSLAGDMFQRTASRYAQDVEVVKVEGHGFVEIVESGEENSPRAERAVREVVEPLLGKGIDKIVLGCTHYPFLAPIIERVVEGEGIDVIDSGEAVARRVEWLLERYAMRRQATEPPQYRFLTFADETYAQKLRAKAATIEAEIASAKH